MISTITPAKIRKRALNALMANGILSIYIGFVLTMIGLLELHQHYWGGEGMQPIYVPVIVIVPLFFMIIAMKRITQQRIGYADMKVTRNWPNRLHLVLVVVFTILLFAVVILIQLFNGSDAGVNGESSGIKPYVGLYFAIFVAAILSILAVLMETTWVHVGSLFFLIVFGLLYLFNLYTGLGFILTGIGLFVSGLILFYRFLKKNPVLLPDDYERSISDE